MVEAWTDRAVPCERHERILSAFKTERFFRFAELPRITGSCLSALRRDRPKLEVILLGEIVEMVEQVIVVADHSKLGRNALVRTIELEEDETLISGTSVQPADLEFMQSSGISCILA